MVVSMYASLSANAHARFQTLGAIATKERE
jgi:hypothetical protein